MELPVDTTLSFDSALSSSGIGPQMLLSAILRAVNDDSMPNSVGKDPVRLFRVNLSLSMSAMRPISVGREPVSLLVYILKFWRVSVIKPSSVGKVPSSLFVSFNLIELKLRNVSLAITLSHCMVLRFVSYPNSVENVSRS